MVIRHVCIPWMSDETPGPRNFGDPKARLLAWYGHPSKDFARKAARRSLDGLRGCFHLSIVLTASGSAVALSAMIENLLRRRHIGSLAFPRLQRWILQGARVGEAHLPRMGTHGVHRIEMLRSAFSALAS